MASKRRTRRVNKVSVPTPPVADQVNTLIAGNTDGVQVGSPMSNMAPTGRYIPVHIERRVLKEERKIYYSDGSIAESVNTYATSQEQQTWVPINNNKESL